MTPEQEIRAAAIQAAATFCSPLGYADGGIIPNPEDVLFVADVFSGYIEGGWQQALEINATGSKGQEPAQQPVETADERVQAKSEPMDILKDVELREQQPAGDAEVTFDPDPVAIPQATPAATSEPAPAQAADTSPNVIPIGVRGSASGPQSEARRRIEKTKRAAAERILSEARTAKAVMHKDRLRDMAEERGLSDFALEIDGRVQTLGTYLASL